MTSLSLIAGCATNGLNNEQPIVEVSTDQDLINRSEVVAVVSSVDVATDLEQQAAHWGYDLKRKEVLPGLGMYLLTFNCPPGIDPHVASLELEKLQPKSTVGVNHKFTIQSGLEVQNTTFGSSLNYANSLIEWPENGCEALTRIGVIDGMVDQESLPAKASYKIISKHFLDDKVARDGTEHGTAIADILVGAGRLNNAVIYNASVISEDETGVEYSGVEPMLKALDWMIQNDVNVVNISLAGPYNRTLERGISRAVDKGLVIVAAVGNDGASSSPRYPAAFSNVIAATAIDSEMQIYGRAVQGDHVDVSAPGVEVLIGRPELNQFVSGTSIATPFVSAKIASSAKYQNAKSIDEIRQFLKQDSLDLGPKGTDPIYGAGLIKAHKCT